ncbi:F-box protein FBW2 isoform X2 [Coffea eugenioides]|uniref:F-box protein FBW2 isoform X2 n=1 Tax=Coffea eugenioides TaxID=49369 RepID=UPI000F60A432|nr:F-box protein FBW2 isoform X2 [Coffea eugenioides]
MEGTDSRHWEDLLPDALGLIFHNLSLQEKLTVIPRVCKPWSKAVMGPYCWQEIDIEEWSNRSESGDVDRMLRMLITRSSGSLRKLCVSGLQNENIFDFIAEHARSLQTLRLPRSEMCDSTMEKIAGRLSILTFLDVSYCSKIGPRALEAIGKNCKFLERLRRNMHPLDVEGVLEIITSCRELEFLDLRGCWDVKFDEKYLKDKFPKLNVLGPHVVDQYEKNAWEDCSDYSDSLYDDYESSDGMWDDDESLELRFYGGYDEASVYGWPPSP